MKIDSRPLSNWLVSSAIVLAFLVLGRPLLVPLVFAILLWGVLNSLVSVLQRWGSPVWLARTVSAVAILAALYLVARILGEETAALMSRGPAYAARFGALFSQALAALHLPPTLRVSDLVSRADVASVLTGAAASAGAFVFALILVGIYVAFLLAEQGLLTGKLALLAADDTSREKAREAVRKMTSQIQAYLGVCTLLSSVMAATTYVVLALLGIDFAGFWALFLFLMTYIPTIGGIAALLPAAMAFLQTGSLETCLIVAAALSAMHFVLANVVQTMMLGRSLNLSSFAIILSLSFWGMIWGVAGLFLAVPMMAAAAIVCEHIEGLAWVAVALSGPPLAKPRRRKPA